MPGENYPVSGTPDTKRYPPAGHGRYDVAQPLRGDAVTYRSLPSTLEEEANAGGWLPGATPTGPTGTLDRLYTIGMRGEPGYDDDPLPLPGTNRYMNGS